VAAGFIPEEELYEIRETIVSVATVLVMVGNDDHLAGIERLGERGGVLCIPLPVTPERLAFELRSAEEIVSLRRSSEERFRLANRYRYEIEEFIDIARALGSERDVKKLLGLILQKSRQITGADAGSVYVVEGEGDVKQRSVRFIQSQNDSMQIDLREFTLPVDEQSIVGRSVLERGPINIRDLYRLDQDPNPWGFRHDKSFDDKYGYQTRSMLTVPMLNKAEEVIGVVQLINKKSIPSSKLRSSEDFTKQVVPFDQRSEELARSLASQAGISLENAILYQEMSRAFQGFVKASVTAIESRDPTTSGHSERVAALTVGLAKQIDRISDGEFAPIKFSHDNLIEIEYASLLHDFGKVGVREHVLVKARKLYEPQRDLVQWRFDYIRKAIEEEGTNKKLQLLLERSRDEAEAMFPNIDRETLERLRELDDYIQFIFKANEPTILAEGSFERLFEIASRRFIDPRGQDRAYLEDYELEALSLPRGSLTENERKEIESHVVHTYNFLKTIPWGKQFKDIPVIAGAHHERLDGTGYPNHFGVSQIPIQSRMMSISDIFDALTAGDRPYKRAMPPERALAIIESEVKSGKCQEGLFRVFVEAEIYKLV
jgi:HD-GYP domain-containing protein (c-di-GMP phosphodiesterase class II)